ncbi:MAG: hypothetical protein GDA56_01335 [Hormoscilla sp. GM7CHS1pb]|nr:hypothetical protein [Hormoscilla sp. GM7CHS1pb]
MDHWSASVRSESANYHPESIDYGCGQKQLVRGDPRRVQDEAFTRGYVILCHSLRKNSSPLGPRNDRRVLTANSGQGWLGVENISIPTENKFIFAKNRLTFAKNKSILSHVKLTFAKNKSILSHMKLTFARNKSILSHMKLTFARNKSILSHMKLTFARNKSILSHIKLTFARNKSILSHIKLTFAKNNQFSLT